jgi:hypothetical protein
MFFEPIALKTFFNSIEGEADMPKFSAYFR